MKLLPTILLAALTLECGLAFGALNPSYPWLADYKATETISVRVAPPEGFNRAASPAGSFETWLRELPLKPGRPPVLLFDGRKKGNQEAHHAVLDVDVGTKDLQQCADAVIRLRAEYLWSVKRLADIHFNFTSGDRAAFTKWSEGFRPVVRGSSVTWARSAAADSSYKSFRAYLDVVFTYAGTASLSAELKPVRDVGDIRPGDVFVTGGSPGHACLVVDVAENAAGEKVFLLAQSYMPAQEIELLRNPNDPKLSPWYSTRFGETLRTPEWTFRRTDLKRF